MTFYEKNDKRHVLIGTVHGAFANCDNSMPGIYVRVDDSSNLQFLHKEALNSGMSNHFFVRETQKSNVGDFFDNWLFQFFPLPFVILF